MDISYIMFFWSTLYSSDCCFRKFKVNTSETDQTFCILESFDNQYRKHSTEIMKNLEILIIVKIKMFSKIIEKDVNGKKKLNECGSTYFHDISENCKTFAKESIIKSFKKKKLKIFLQELLILKDIIEKSKKQYLVDKFILNHITNLQVKILDFFDSQIKDKYDLTFMFLPLLIFETIQKKSLNFENHIDLLIENKSILSTIQKWFREYLKDKIYVYETDIKKMITEEEIVPLKDKLTMGKDQYLYKKTEIN